MTSTTVKPLRPMRVVLGGIPALDDIVGREDETAAVLATFQGHGALITGDRRFGKTSLTRLVEVAAQQQEHHVVRVSAERRNLEDFVQALADALAAQGSAFRREVEKWQLSISAGPVSLDRQRSHRGLDTLVAAALDADPARKLVLCIDEVPLLAQAMERQEPGSGGALLHLLRRIRQEHSGRLVMVLSGSIGFHHVTEDALGAVNDVERIAVGALKPADAVHLARCLLLGEGVPTVRTIDVGTAIAAASEGVPYYIHQLVRSARRLSEQGARTVEASDVARLVDAAMIDPDDPWDLRHYRDRIASYYAEDEPTVVATLDIYAASDTPIAVDEAKRLLNLADLDQRPTRSELIRLVERLEADHYLRRSGADDTFASQIVRRAWLSWQRR